jgi:hypothetical protein
VTGPDHQGDAGRAGPETVPLELWRRHRQLAVGDQVTVTLPGSWCEERVDDVLLGAGFAPVDRVRDRRGWRSDVRRERTLADTVGPGMALLCVGLNPASTRLTPAWASLGPETASGPRCWPRAWSRPPATRARR